MEKLTAKLSESILDKFSMDFLRSQVLKNAYGNDDTVIAALDPRILIVWYLFFGLVPWFVNDIPFLLGCFLLVMATTILARVAGLVLFLFPKLLLKLQFYQLPSIHQYLNHVLQPYIPNLLRYE